MKYRCRLKTFSLAHLVLALCSGNANAEDATPDWMLMSRHGECVEISSLEQKLPNLPNIYGPESLVEFFDSEGYFVDSKELRGSAGRAYEISVSDLLLSLMMVRETLCPK